MCYLVSLRLVLHICVSHEVCSRALQFCDLRSIHCSFTRTIAWFVVMAMMTIDLSDFIEANADGNPPEYIEGVVKILEENEILKLSDLVCKLFVLNLCRFRCGTGIAGAFEYCASDNAHTPRHI